MTRKAEGMPAVCVHRVGSWWQVAPGPPPPRATKRCAQGRRQHAPRAGSHVLGEVTHTTQHSLPPRKVRGRCSQEHSKGELGGQ